MAEAQEYRLKVPYEDSKDFDKVNELIIAFAESKRTESGQTIHVIVDYEDPQGTDVVQVTNGTLEAVDDGS